MDDELAAARMKTTLELFDAGVEIQRQNLRRRHPEATEEEIEARLRAWLSDRPGAPYGDAPGRGRRHIRP